MIEKVNRSKVLKAKVENKILMKFGRVMKLRNSPTHQCSATENVFIWLLKCWNLCQAFLETDHSSKKYMTGHYYWNFDPLSTLFNIFKEWHKK